MKNTIFYLGMAILLTHELDAMVQHEWRVLPLIRLLPEMMAMQVFILAHIPLFALLIAAVASQRLKVRHMARLAVAVFLLLHAILHVLFADHSAYEFASLTSDVLIFGGAVFGALYLLLVMGLRVKSVAE